jgi:serpin B
VYLKGQWLDQFPAKATSDAPFYPDRAAGGTGASVPVAMMHSTSIREYLRGNGYQAVLLPFFGTPLAMAVVLPDGPLSGLRPRLAAAGLRGLLAGTSRYQVALSLPRFRVETGFDLAPVLRQLGVRHAFDRTADFSGITEAEKLSISAVAHKAYIDVDEYGAEAAAATAVVMRMRAGMLAPRRVELVVDRPFLIAIVDTTTGLPLFLGQVSKPAAVRA